MSDPTTAPAAAQECSACGGYKPSCPVCDPDDNYERATWPAPAARRAAAARLGLRFATEAPVASPPPPQPVGYLVGCTACGWEGIREDTPPCPGCGAPTDYMDVA